MPVTLVGVGNSQRAEAHVHEQLEHSAPQERPQRDHGGLAVVAAAGERAEAGDEAVARPLPGGREEGEAGRLQRLAGEVAAHEAPVGPVGRGTDVAAAGAEEAGWVDGRWAVGEGGDALDEGAVREAAVGDEDERAGEAEGDDGAVARVHVLEERGEVEDGRRKSSTGGREEGACSC
uniref:DUF834 domain-containing protein n=1 Tax=Setaria italica TaxID=4555 RepID=A0A0Q3T699_SETIT